MNQFMQIMGDRLGDVYSERGLGGLYGMGMDSAVGRKFSVFRKDYKAFFELPWYGDLMVGCNPIWVGSAWATVLLSKFLSSLPGFEQSFGRVEVCTFGGLFCSTRDSFWFYDFLKALSTDRWFLVLSFLTVGNFFGSVRLADSRKRNAFVSMIMVGVASWYFSSFSIIGQFCCIGEVYAAVLAVLIAKDVSAGFSLFYFWFLMKLVIGFPLPGFLVIWFFSQVSVEEQVVAAGGLVSETEVDCEDKEMDEVFRKVFGVERPRIVDARHVWKVDPQDVVKFEKVEKYALKGDRMLKVMLTNYALDKGATTEQCSVLEQLLQSDRSFTTHVLMTDKSWLDLPQRYRGAVAATTLEAVCGVWFEYLSDKDYRSKEMFQHLTAGVANSIGKKLKGVVVE